MTLSGHRKKSTKRAFVNSASVKVCSTPQYLILIHQEIGGDIYFPSPSILCLVPSSAISQYADSFAAWRVSVVFKFHVPPKTPADRIPNLRDVLYLVAGNYVEIHYMNMGDLAGTRGTFTLARSIRIELHGLQVEYWVELDVDKRLILVLGIGFQTDLWCSV